MNPTAIFCPYGPVQSRDGVYLRRPADQQLLDLCLNNCYSYVLTSRQVGKSSLLWATAERLRERDVAVSVVDLQQIGSHITSEKWYASVLHLIKKLGLKIKVSEWWKERENLAEAQRFQDFFREVVLEQIKQPIVIFIDEVDITFNLSFRDDFFAAIRAMYHARGREPSFERLSFVLIGAATPNDLVSDASRSPFNIGEEVLLDDFTLEQALPLSRGLNLPEEEARQVLQWILEWSSGHPYLTQTLCIKAAETGATQWTRARVDQMVETFLASLANRQDIHFGPIRKRLLDNTDLLRTYGAVLRRPISYRKRNQHHVRLELLGLIRNRDDRFRIRNRLYKKVFHKGWVKENLEIDWNRLWRQVGVVFLPAIFLLMFAWYAVVLQIRLDRESELSMQKDVALQEKDEALREKDAVQVSLEARKRELEARKRELEDKTRALEDALLLTEQREKALEQSLKETRLAREKEQVARQDAENERQRASLEAQALTFLLDGQIEEAAATLDKTLAFSPDKARTLLRIGNIFRANEDYPQAENYYRRAEKVYQQSQEPAGHMNALTLIAEMQLIRGFYDTAREPARQALTLDATPDATLTAHYLLGQVDYQTGNYANAAVHVAKALEAAERSEVGHYGAAARILSARLTFQNGLPVKALADLEAVMDRVPLENTWENKATALNLKGMILTQLAKYHEARGAHMEALASSRASGNRDEEKVCLFYLAELSLLQGYEDEGRTWALKYLENPRSRKPMEALYDLARTGMINARLGYPEEAESQLNEALAGLESRNNRIMLPEIHLAAGDVAHKTGHFDKAMTRYQTALDEAKQSGNQTWLIRTYEKLAGLYAVLGRTQEAEDIYTEAISEVRNRGQEIDELRLLTGIGQMFRTSRASLAQSMFATVITKHQNLFAKADTGFKADLAEIAGDAYDARFVQYMYQNQIRQAYESAEEARYFTSMGRFGKRANALLDDIEHQTSWLTLMESVGNDPNKPGPVVDALQQKLGSGQAVLAYYLMEDETYAFLVTRDQVIWDSMRGELFLSPLLQPPALHRPLYLNLIMPFEEQLTGVQQIHIIPHGILLALPASILEEWSQRLQKLSPDTPAPEFHITVSSRHIASP